MRYTTLQDLDKLPKTDLHGPFNEEFKCASPITWSMYAKALLMVVAGITAGTYLATGLAHVLGRDGLDVFTYVPEDDENADKDSKENEMDSSEREVSRRKMMTTLFGDYRLNLSFTWGDYDGKHVLYFPLQFIHQPQRRL